MVPGGRTAAPEREHPYSFRKSRLRLIDIRLHDIYRVSTLNQARVLGGFSGCWNNQTVSALQYPQRGNGWPSRIVLLAGWQFELYTPDTRLILPVLVGDGRFGVGIVVHIGIFIAFPTSVLTSTPGFRECAKDQVCEACPPDILSDPAGK